MAEADVKKILECSICFDNYKHPKMLPCQHSFCLKCIYDTYKTKKESGNIFACPLCNQKVDLKKTNKNFILTQNDFNACLPDNFTLKNLLDVVQKPVPAPRKVTIAENSSTSEKPAPLPRKPKPPPPDPPGHRLSMIPEETVPSVPLRRLPNKDIMSAFKLEADIASIVTPKKILADSKGNIYVGFVEDAGIRKYDGKNGEFLLKFAAAGVITDFSLDRNLGEIVCLITTDTGQGYLQSYNSTNGQRLKCLKWFGVDEGFAFITNNHRVPGEFILACCRCLAVYNIKQDVFKYVPHLPNLPNLSFIRAMECNKHGALYILFGGQPKPSPIIYVITLSNDSRTSSISYPVPIDATDIDEPVSFSISVNNLYVCDFGKRCVHVYRKVKPDIIKTASVISKPNYFSWKPTLVCCSDNNNVYIMDSDKKIVFMYSDKQ